MDAASAAKHLKGCLVSRPVKSINLQRGPKTPPATTAQERSDSFTYGSRVELPRSSPARASRLCRRLRAGSSLPLPPERAGCMEEAGALGTVLARRKGDSVPHPLGSTLSLHKGPTRTAPDERGARPDKTMQCAEEAGSAPHVLGGLSPERLSVRTGA